MKKIKLLLVFLIAFGYSNAQFIGREGYNIWMGNGYFGHSRSGAITPPNSSVWVQFGDSATTKGLWLPRVQHVSDITSPRQGMFMYCIDSSNVLYHNGTTWKKAGGTAAQTFQDVLITGSAFTQANTINTGGYKTTWQGTGSDTMLFDNAVLKLITRTNAWTQPGIILQSSDTARRYISNFMPERMIFRKNGYYDPGCSTCGLDGHQFIWYTNATEGGVDTLVNNMGAHIGPNDKHFYLADQTDTYAGPGIPANRLLSVEKNGAGYFSWYNNPANNNPQVLVGFYPAWAISGYETYRMVIGGKLGVNDSAYFKKKAWFEDTVRYSKPTYHDTNTVYVKNLKNQNPGYADRRFVIGQDLAGGIGPEWSDGSLVGFYNQFGYHYLQSYSAPANGFWVGTYPGAWQEYKKDGRITFSTNTPTAQKFTFSGSGNFSDTLIAKTVGTSDSSDVAATTKWVKQQGYGTGGGGGSGVTSVATNTATGITGGTITTTGTLAIDTILVGTRLWRQKGIDSLQGNITSGLSGKVNISDTATMLAGYTRVQRFLDSLSNHTTRFNGVTTSLAGKVNVSDTATMLANYTRVQRFLDSLSGHTTRFNGVTTSLASKLNISDTATMLANYTRVQRFLDSLTNHTTRFNSVTSSLATKLNISDTTTKTWDWADVTGKPSLTLNSDTASMLANYVDRQELKDTAAAIRSAIGSGGGANNYPTGVTYTQSSRTLAIQRNGLSDISTTIPTATSSLPGLMSAADKARLDSNSYVQNVIRSGFDTLSRKKNDSTLQIKAIQLVAGSNVTITPTITDTTASYTIAATGGGGGVSDGDKGDITISSSGTVYTIDNSTVTLAKMANIGTGKVIGRTTAGSGVPEEVTAAIINTTSLANNDHLEYNSGTGEWNNKATMALTKVSITGATQDTVVLSDMIPVYDATEATNKKVRVDDLMHTYYRQFRRTSAFDYYNEFLNTPTTTSNGNDLLATNSGTSAATSAQATDAANRIGLVRTTTGTTATGRSYVNASASSIRLGGGTWVFETYVNITTLSTSAERYQSLFGFFDTYTAANQVDGVYILYDEGGASTGSTASANWQLVTASNSTRTFSTSSTAVAAATWVKLRVEINAAGTRADFFVNDTNIGNITTNIPTASGRELGFGWGMIKSVGTTARTLDVDYVLATTDYTTDK